jgi:hypothetical protein
MPLPKSPKPYPKLETVSLEIRLLEKSRFNSYILFVLRKSRN